MLAGAATHLSGICAALDRFIHHHVPGALEPLDLTEGTTYLDAEGNHLCLGMLPQGGCPVAVTDLLLVSDRCASRKLERLLHPDVIVAFL